jgi:hypothetical protein
MLQLLGTPHGLIINRWANVTAGSTCVVENTPYIAYGLGGDEFIDIVSRLSSLLDSIHPGINITDRDNCHLGFYCDASKLVCMGTKSLKEACTADKELVQSLLRTSCSQ